MVDAIFILQRCKNAMQIRRKNYSCVLWTLKKAFDRLPRHLVEWTHCKRTLPEALVRNIMALYEDESEMWKWII